MRLMNKLKNIKNLLYFIIYNKLNKPETISIGKIVKFSKINLIEVIDKAGGLTIQELVSVLGICSIYPSGNLLEIGSFRGRTALNIIYNFPDLKTFTFDLPDQINNEKGLKYNLVESDKAQAFHHKKKELKVKYKEYFSKINSLEGDSAIYDFSKYDNFFDIIIVDGSHKYENVVIDSENAIKMIKKNGYIIWHDYSKDHIDVLKAIRFIKKKYSIKINRLKHTKFVFYKK
tara:strand:+ start:350 stop:1042 length:693 start_codon:yes stop_codon:yes gene_type:complete